MHRTPPFRLALMLLTLLASSVAFGQDDAADLFAPPAFGKGSKKKEPLQVSASLNVEKPGAPAVQERSRARLRRPCARG